MAPVFLPDLRMNAQVEGPLNGAPLVLIHGLGLNLHIWDELVTALPKHRILRFDLRGHGGSDVPKPPYSMGALIRDSEKLMEHFGFKDAVVVGHGLGGLVAQGLAVKRLDLIRALVLSNTAAKIGTTPQWEQSLELARDKGLIALHDTTMARWLGRNWKVSSVRDWLSAAFMATPVEGWLGGAGACKGTDFYETTSTLRLPTLAIAGGQDGITPADLMRETADLILGHQFKVMRAGHLPMVEKPAEYATVMGEFLASIGHF